MTPQPSSPVCRRCARVRVALLLAAAVLALLLWPLAPSAPVASAAAP